MDIVVPVYNEAVVVAHSIDRLRRYLDSDFPFTWRITIVDNASTDETWTEGTHLAALDARIIARHLNQKGRGRALRAAWSESDATIVAYMDVDLSTDLRALLPLVAPLVSGHSDVSIGSRLLPTARVEREPRREFISRTYNRILRLVFRNRFHDAQCGFKAMRADIARRILPEIQDEEWFFDPELLLVAEHNGLRISEIPVDWTDDPDTRVNVRQTAIDDLKGTARVARSFWRGRGYVELDGLERPPTPAGSGGELVSFAVVGALSTVVYFALFFLLRHVMSDLWANAAALAATMLANTVVHRRWTFGRRGAPGRTREWGRAVVVHAAGLGLTSMAILAAYAIDGGSVVSLTVLLLAASVASAALRFLLMPAWVFRKARS